MSLSLVATAQPEAKTQTEVPAAPPMSPEDELFLLERSALEKGMSNEELFSIQQIGDCDQQVQTRIGRLHEWHSSH